MPALNFNTGVLLGQSFSYSNTLSNAAVGDSATLTESISPGVIHLYSATSGCNGENSSCAGSGFSDTDLEYGDTITANSATVAAGTVVPFTFTLSMRYSIQYLQSVDGITPGGGASIWFQGSPFFTQASDFGRSLGSFEPGANCFSFNGLEGNNTVSCTQTVFLTVGQSSWFVQRLGLRNDTPLLADGTAIFDASNTEWLTITPLESGVSFTTGSGYDYAGDPDARSAVPEPASLALLGSGMVGIAVSIRRKSMARRFGAR
jgi:hypothetical protein